MKTFFLDETAAVDHQNIIFVGLWASINAYLYAAGSMYVLKVTHDRGSKSIG